MAEVILFNHIPKTAGSTLKHVLWQTVGGERVLFATIVGQHPQEVQAIAARLDRPLEDRYAIVAHTGCGIEQRLPPRHSYNPFTVLRDPVQRTISAYFYVRRQWTEDADPRSALSIEEFLDQELARAFNTQTAFLGGLLASHQLDGVPLRREQFDGTLLEQAKRNLDAQAVVGLTERFDETLILLADVFEWPLLRTLYRPANVNASRREAPPISPSELEAVEAANRLDMEIYAYAQERMEADLSATTHWRKLRRLQRLNAIYRRLYPVTYPPARTLVRFVRRARG
jgi:hypothetical protein